MSHVAPHRWADLAAGKLPARVAASIQAHADGCSRCAGARERVLGARLAMKAVGEAAAPRAGWDLLGARLYWTVSSEKRRRQREDVERTRAWWKIALPPFAVVFGLGLCALAAWGVLRREALPPMVAFVPPPVPAAAIPFTLVDGPRALAGTVTLREDEGELGVPVGAGARLEAGRGRLGVQIGLRSAFVLEPGSVLTIVRLDEREVDLLLETGAVALEVEPRLPGQSFRVRGAGHTAEVRGTAFRVGVGGDRFEVGVAHGLVVVDGAAEVGAGGRLDGKPLDARASEALLAWTRLAIPAGDATGELHIQTRSAAVLRLDGLALGAAGGWLRVRTNAGRHLVEIGDKKRWITVEAGGRAEVRAEPAPSRSERPSQVDAQMRMHRERFAACAARAQRRSPEARGEVVVEIGIHVGGELDFVAPLSTPDSDPAFEQCVINVVRTHFSFPAGSRATVQKTIAF
jgi:FecR protein